MSIVDQTLMQLARHQESEPFATAAGESRFPDVALPFRKPARWPWLTLVLVVGAGLGGRYLPVAPLPPVPARPVVTVGESASDPLPIRPVAEAATVVPVAITAIQAAATPPVQPTVAADAPALDPAAASETTPDRPLGVPLAPDLSPDPRAPVLLTGATGWLPFGWSRLLAGDFDAALATWEGGLRSLPDDRRIVVGFAYLESARGEAIRRAKAIPGGFVIREVNRESPDKSPIFRVLVLPTRTTALVQARVLKTQGYAVSVMNSAYLRDFLYLGSQRVGIDQPIPARPPVAGSDLGKPALAPARTSAQQVAIPPPLPAAEPPVALPAPASNPTPAVVASRDDGDRLLSSARSALRAGDFTEAARRARELTVEQPEQWEGWFVLGTAELASGHLAAADQALEQAARRNPRSPSVLTQRALLAQERGEHDTAVRFLEDARQLSPRQPEIYLNLGISNEALRNAGAAEAAYLSFIALTERQENAGSYGKQRHFVTERLKQLQQ